MARNDLEGTWETACYQRAKTRLTYTNLKLTGVYTEYSDDACTASRHISTWTGTATGGEELATGVHQLDLAYDTYRSKPLTTTEAGFVNQNAFCGFTDWAANAEKDVLGRSCYGFAIPVGGSSLDIYQRNANTLQFGKGSKIGTSLTASDRPTEIDPLRVFSRL